ncbi:MAG TPA: NUDIX domain-containing protein [Candidatus Paceibacterota bacterium]
MKNVIKFFRPVIVLLSRTFWFIFRPHTRGAKIVLVSGGEILLIKNTYGYKYTLPGGGIKKTESPEAGLKREIKEELGIDLETTRLLGSFVSTAEYKKDEVFAFAGGLSKKEVYVDNFEIDEVKWFQLDKLPSLGPVTMKVLDLYYRAQ